MLNIEDPAPFWMVVVLLLCYLGFSLSPNSFQEFVYQACALGANEGKVFLDSRPLGNIPTLFTHTFLHAGWGHVLMMSGFILAFGIITIRGVQFKHIPIMGVIRRGSAVFLAIFLLGAVVGGLAQWLQWFVFKETGVLFGATTSMAALFASSAWVLGGRKNLFIFIIVLVAFDAFNIAMGARAPWAGHLGGYLAGAALAVLWIKPNSSGIDIFG